MHNNNLSIFKLDVDKTLELRKAWEKCFIPIGTDREKIHPNSYLWHIFSYEVRECEQQEQAIMRFNEMQKDKIFIFYQSKDIGYEISNEKALHIKI